jgi:hypothetical protein
VLPSHRTRIFGNRGGRAYGGCKAIPAAEFGADKVAVLAESLAQQRDLNLEVRCLDKNARPDKGHEFVFCDKRPVGVDEDHQDIYGASAKFDRYTIGEQLPLPRQYAETAELDRPVACVRARKMPKHSRTRSARWLAFLSSYDRL